MSLDKNLSVLSWVRLDKGVNASNDSELVMQFDGGGIGLTFSRGMKIDRVINELRHAADLLERRTK